jgi:hypothetical protein
LAQSYAIHPRIIRLFPFSNTVDKVNRKNQVFNEGCSPLFFNGENWDFSTHDFLDILNIRFFTFFAQRNG